MSIEERFLEAIDEDEEECGTSWSPDWREKRHQQLQQKNRTTINQFLGKGRRTNHAGILPRYYGELLTWSLHRYMEREGWRITATIGYHGTEPIYINVNTGSEIENLLTDGQMLIEKGEIRYIVTVDVNPRLRGSVQLEGPVKNKKEMTGFITGVLTIAEKENFYRGKKIEFSGRIRFLNVKDRSWDSIVLDSETKREIKANSVDFLKRSDEWSQYGIPLKRGVLLAGEPGTGKTIICRALMAEVDGITCIITNSYALDVHEYVTELYELAEDLSPCIVFIEDIDLIGQNRMEFGYQRGPALLSLLSVMDGVEEQREVVTIATTNCLETMDKALSERPARFDRVIQLSLPSKEQRIELVRYLCEKIPLADDTQEYIAVKTENCTPAQLQEIVFSLVIRNVQNNHNGLNGHFDLNTEQIDKVISALNGRCKNHIGFVTRIGGKNGKDETTAIRK